MLVALVIALSAPSQQSVTLGEEHDIVALLHQQTTIEAKQFTQLRSLQALQDAVSKLGWTLIESDRLLVLVDSKLLDFRALEVQEELTAQLVTSGSDQSGAIDFSDFSDATRLSLSKSLIQSKPTWWPLFEREDLTLRFQPKAEIIFESGSGSRTYYLELPMSLQPPPLYEANQRVDIESARIKSVAVGLPNRTSALPSSLSVKVLSSLSGDRWSAVPDAIEATMARYSDLVSGYAENVASYLRGQFDGTTVDMLLSAKTGADLPSRIFDQLVSIVEGRRARFGVPDGFPSVTWVSRSSLKKISFMLFAEFRYKDTLGNIVRVSIGLRHGRDERP